jgi:hypothetical protein
MIGPLHGPTKDGGLSLGQAVIASERAATTLCGPPVLPGVVSDATPSSRW